MLSKRAQQQTLALSIRQKELESIERAKAEIKAILSGKTKSNVEMDKEVSDKLNALRKIIDDAAMRLVTMVAPAAPPVTRTAAVKQPLKKNFDYGQSPYMNMDKLDKITDQVNDAEDGGAVIRGDELDEQCPFGLPIPQACHEAASCVKGMVPLQQCPESERVNCGKNNLSVLNQCSEKCICMFADKIMDNQKKVVCKFGEMYLQKSVPFRGSPIYPQVWSGLAGETNSPQGYYGDNMSSRNLWYGLFSLQGYNQQELEKFSSKMIDSLNNIKSKYPKEFEIVSQQILKHINKDNIIEVSETE